MASKIKDTPMLTGKDAERFIRLQKRRKHETPETIRRIIKNYEKFKVRER